MRVGPFLGVVFLAAAFPAAISAEPVAPKGPLDTIADIRQALYGCWKWPAKSEAHPNMELTMRLSFSSKGEILDAHLTYEKQDVPEEERARYHSALLDALKLCLPLPLSVGLGEAVAGRPLILHIHDTRKISPL